MGSIGAVLVFLCVLLLSSASASWLRDLRTSRGMHLGGGFSLKLDERNARNASFFERLSLRYDDSAFAVSLGKAANRDNALHLGFYAKERSKGRDAGSEEEEVEDIEVIPVPGKKVGDVVIPTLMGFKMASITTMAVFGIALFVVKVLGIAKLALLVSGALFVSRYLQQKEEHVQIYAPADYEQQASEQHPFYADYNGLQEAAAAYNAPSAAAAANYYAYANYAGNTVQENAAAESTQNFAIVEAPPNVSNATGVQNQQEQTDSAKRREYVRRKSYTTAQKKPKKNLVRN